MATKRPVALVTAAAGAGIGAAVARRLAHDGLDVVVTDAHQRRCQEFADALAGEVGREINAHHLDVTDHDQVRAVMSEVAAAKGGLDVLVNNAGWSRIEPVAEMSLETWQRCLDVDLTGTFVCMRHALPAMIDSGGGSIINISSIAAWEMSTEHGAAYSAAKAGVLALTRVAAAENGAHGVRVNAVAPGLIYNDFLRRIYPEEFFDDYLSRKAVLERIGRPEDVAGMVSFLASDEASYVTGEVFTVSGGVSARG
ncbi:MAG: SDR family oxidoreductase [Acidimicrobiaceae bacterium]|nr:SDR family oxidoreductase [Acidimicrobiaceae bacterium]MXZ64099.1 SDR family oxidoreductase [Acidimicrobiaceae bacterium]MXZ99477.1 SDR family oxidoreductase [Acidimicrobiaceae bacterium]MYF31839.1 SDR family oxidoreductase [Acidimicrobiaceae bacterium]MYG77091.1 SDR family oxidoreductase [Acidimicrobiaceae bacterium]